MRVQNIWCHKESLKTNSQFSTLSKRNGEDVKNFPFEQQTLIYNWNKIIGYINYIYLSVFDRPKKKHCVIYSKWQQHYTQLKKQDNIFEVH